MYTDTGDCFSHKFNTLLVATTEDAASLNIATALKQSSGMWTTHWASKESTVYYAKATLSSSTSSSSGSSSDGCMVWLWIQDQPLLHLNNVHQLLNRELLARGIPRSASGLKPRAAVSTIVADGNDSSTSSSHGHDVAIVNNAVSHVVSETTEKTDTTPTMQLIEFDEVMFLSKHCAASGKASLTVHPIGESPTF